MGMGSIGAALAVAACVAPSAPSGSTGGAASPSKEKVTLRWDVSDATDIPVMMDMGKKAAPLFAEKFPNIEVVAEPPPDVDANEAPAILTEMVAGEAPDVIGYCCDALPLWASKGQLLKLDPYVEKDMTQAEIDDYAPAQWNAFTNPRTGRYALPMYMGSIVLYYNKDAFDAKGVAYPDNTWNWTVDGNGKYEDALRKFADADNKIWGGQMGDGPDRLQQKLVANGGHWVDPKDDMKAAFDQEAALDALQWEYDRIWKDKIVINQAALEKQSSDILMGLGRIAMFESGDWYLSSLVKTSPGKYNWDIAPLPQGPVTRNSLATTDGWGIWTGSKYHDEAWEFLHWLQSDEWNELMIKTGLLRPSRKSLFDKWVSLVTESVPDLAKVNLKAFGEALDYATPLELFQYNPQAVEIINAARDTTLRANSNPDVKSVFAQAAKDVNAAEDKASKQASSTFVVCGCGEGKL